MNTRRPDTHIPTEFLSPEQQARRRARILAIQDRFKHRRKAREEKRHAPRKPAPLPPVYDDVWAEGVRWLDEEG